ncbi:hypothetical protein C8Q73DRAFT_666148 [Cubamyces lactineus]|nr:hypothetical protein C8Q73DRAFT_666148 [Cubamyces lactineus]
MPFAHDADELAGAYISLHLGCGGSGAACLFEQVCGYQMVSSWQRTRSAEIDERDDDIPYANERRTHEHVDAMSVAFLHHDVWRDERVDSDGKTLMTRVVVETCREGSGTYLARPEEAVVADKWKSGHLSWWNRPYLNSRNIVDIPGLPTAGEERRGEIRRATQRKLRKARPHPRRKWPAQTLGRVAVRRDSVTAYTGLQRREGGNEIADEGLHAERMLGIASGGSG